jgi:glycosyltransferase involved in cell wall biosynthesis
MKKIAILTSGRLPVPATRGGAVETKLDYILDYNAAHRLLDITVYSVVPDREVVVDTTVNHYVHYSLSSSWSKIRRKIYKTMNREPYYDEHIEYFLQRCLVDMRGQPYDAVIIANRPGYAMKLAASTSYNIILQINNDYLNTNTGKAIKIKEACSLVITCSDYLTQRAASVPTQHEVPVKTVHNGIDISRFVNAVPVDRKQLGLDENDFVVFFSGRLTKEKGILELIKAIRQLPDIDRLKLVIAGASFYGRDSGESPYMKQLKAEAEEVKEKVIFTGFVDYRQMPSYLKTASVAVVPSLWEEPFGLTVLEAMAAGVPLVATRCGGIPEVCADTAMLIDRTDVSHHLADAIRFIHDHPQEAVQMGQRAQERSWTFDKEIFAKNYLDMVIAAIS